MGKKIGIIVIIIFSLLSVFDVARAAIPYIAAGGNTFVIKTDGTLWGWGPNNKGQLGNGTTHRSYTPTQIGINTDWQVIDTGVYHSIAIKSDGTLWAWGDNIVGVLGYGTYPASSLTPVKIGTDNRWKDVSTSGDHNIAIKTDGTLWAWGYNFYGQLGDGTNTIKYTPVQIGVDNRWATISAGSSNTFAIKTDGTLWAWGINSSGQLGDGTSTNRNTPVQIGTDNKWLSVSAGGGHTLALKTDGTIWGWGNNSYGQLGDGTNINSYIPIQISTDNNWSVIIAGSSYSLGLKKDGTLWAWGYNFNGRLGDGTNINKNNPVQIGTDNRWIMIDSGGGYSIALKSDGTLWAWGDNSSGQLGDGSSTLSFPTRIGISNNWTSVSTGILHSIAIKSDGTLWWWGGNPNACCRHVETSENIYNPVQIGIDNNWIAISAGGYHSLALKSNGTLWAWGSNRYGQLGDGTSTLKMTPVQVGTDTNWIAISAGQDHSIAMKSDGTLWAWGYGGILGDGTSTTRSTPVQIGTDNTWTSFDAGARHNVAIKSDGTLWAWGLNSNGQLGTGDNTWISRNTPTRIGTDNIWASIAAGGLFTIALKSDGTLWAWGDNNFGQIGDGTTITKGRPAQIGTDNTWRTIAAGGSHTLAFKSDNSLWAWGYNDFNQLGDGSTINRSTPQQIGTDISWASISGGFLFSFALQSDGSLWGWGDNSKGQLGNGIIAAKYYPVEIISLWLTCTDIDGDGYGSPGNSSCINGDLTDCDDNNASINPAANEICDGIDNNCNGFIDENYPDLGSLCSAGIGVCSASGVMVCNLAGTGTTCNAIPGTPSAEVCDGSDNDCNGQIDNGIADIITGSDIGACQTEIQSCVNGSMSVVQPSIAPSSEVCDLLDNDCNGFTDEDYPDLGTLCSAGIGACSASGTMVCNSAGSATTCNAIPGTPSTEVCDGVDNNCNGQADDGIADIITGSDIGACQSEIQSCINGSMSVVQPSIGPSSEVCDLLDNDCNGFTDEDYPDLGTLCSAGIGACSASGTMVCNSAGSATTCNAIPGTPSTEVCDGVDNDCNGQADDGIADIITGSDIGACQSEIQSCINGAMAVIQTAIGPSTETCDGSDNDCNGQIDNGILTTYYIDSDSDGYGNINQTTQSCNQPNGYVEDNSDCDDNNTLINPAAIEICNDNKDNNCNGNIDKTDIKCTNTPPVAEAGADMSLSCLNMTCPVILDGSGSTDADSTPGTQDDIVSYKWFEYYGSTDEVQIASGKHSTTDLSLGNHQITLVVTDKAGATDTDVINVRVNPTQLSLFEINKAEVEWEKAGEKPNRVKIHGRVAMPVGKDYYQVSPSGRVSIGISSASNALDQNVTFQTKGDYGSKWEYKADPIGIGITKFDIDWDGAKFDYNKEIRLKSNHLGYNSTTLEIDRKSVTDSLTITINDITIHIDTTGLVKAIPEIIKIDSDDDGEIEVELPFALSMNTIISVSYGNTSYGVKVGDYYSAAVGKFELIAVFDSKGLDGNARPATLDFGTILGDQGFPGVYKILEGDWSQLKYTEWKYKR